MTHTHMVPTMFHRLLRAARPRCARKYDVSSLRYVVHGAAPCPVARQAGDDRVARARRLRVLRGDRRRRHVRRRRDEWLRKPGTVGKPTPGTVQILRRRRQRAARRRGRDRLPASARRGEVRVLQGHGEDRGARRGELLHARRRRLPRRGRLPVPDRPQRQADHLAAASTSTPRRSTRCCSSTRRWPTPP